MTIQRGAIYFVNLNPVKGREQIRSLDTTRFPPEAAGNLSEEKMNEIEAAVRYCLGL